ncbi:MAG: hypothetical protein Q9187_006700 [Circinaria calcarea]
MPLPIIAQVVFKGIHTVPFALPVLKTIPWLILLYLLKLYFGGIGGAVAHSLAQRGAQIILLSHHAPSDPFLVDYIEDLRASTNNELIYAEQVDLSSLHSIRLFATKWVDNAPPRRLDMVILCADTMTPRYGIKALTQDKLETAWGINYLANFHLLSILSPALRAQPADRDVRIIFGTCSSYIGGDLKSLKDTREPLPKGFEYGTSKLATMVFAEAFQKHLDAYERPDKQSNNARVVLVDPGFTRTPGMRRWLTMGSLWGLLGYLIVWPFWWLILKSPEQGAQTFLYATMEADLGRGVGGRFLKECKEIDFLRKEVRDEEVAKKLWGFSEKQIEALEKEGAVKRALAKKEKEEREKKIAEKEKDVDGGEKTSPTNGKSGKVTGSRRSRKAG